MAYKQPSSGPFKMMGSSPAEQKDKSDLTSRVANIITDKTASRAKSGESNYYPFDTGLDEYSGKKKTSPPMEPNMTMNKASRINKIESDKDILKKGKKKVDKVSIKNPKSAAPYTSPAKQTKFPKSKGAKARVVKKKETAHKKMTETPSFYSKDNPTGQPTEKYMKQVKKYSDASRKLSTDFGVAPD